MNQNTLHTQIHQKNAGNTKLMSICLAGIAIINMYLGLGLLSYPYALYKGGPISFIILFFICIFMSWTGKLLVRCFIKMRPSRKTYPDVGRKSFGKCGSSVISLDIICEYCGAIGMILVI